MLNKNRAYTQGIGRSKVVLAATGVDNSADIGTRTLVPGLREDDLIVSVWDVTDSAFLTDNLRTFRGAKTALEQNGVGNTSLDFRAKTPLTTRIILAIGGTEPVVTVANDSATQVTITITFPNPTTAAAIASAVRNHYVAGRLVSVNNTSGHTGAGEWASNNGTYTLGLDNVNTHDEAAEVGYNNNQGGTRAYARIAQGAATDTDMFIVAKEVGVTTAYAVEFVDPSAPSAALAVSYSEPTLSVSLATNAASALISTYAQIVAAINNALTVAGGNLFRAYLPYGQDGSGVAPALGSQNFTVGLGAGIILDGDFAADVLQVEVDRRDNTPTESLA